MISKQDIKVLEEFYNQCYENFKRNDPDGLPMSKTLPALQNIISLAKKFMECEGELDFDSKDDIIAIIDNINVGNPESGDVDLLSIIYDEDEIEKARDKIIDLCQIPYTKLKIELEEKEKIIKGIKEIISEEKRDSAPNSGAGRLI